MMVEAGSIRQGGVIGVIGARLNSSRLPDKHLLDLAGKPLIERLFERLEQVPQFDYLILATTSDHYNQPLVEWAQKSGRQVFAFDGDVNDLVGRIDAVLQQYEPRLVAYFCGDSPLIEPNTVAKMVQAALDTPAAGQICLQPGVPGKKVIHEGIAIYPIATWRRLVQQSVTADEREHVGVAIKKFIHELVPAVVDDEPQFCTVEHRISVDTPSDYHFMREIYERWYESNPQTSLVSLHWVMEMLESDSELRAINAGVQQRAVGRPSARVVIVPQAGNGVGLGHLRRMIRVARALQDQITAGVELLIHGQTTHIPGLEFLPHRFIECDRELERDVLEACSASVADVVVFDVAPLRRPSTLNSLLTVLNERDIHCIAVDGLFDLAQMFDLIYVPSFYLAPQYQHWVAVGKVVFGADKYFLPVAPQRHTWSPGDSVTIFTGGSSVQTSAETWPAILDRGLNNGLKVRWVKGPYAALPQIPQPPRLTWQCLDSPEDMTAVMARSHIALTQYGVTLFELLQQGVPTVVLQPDGMEEEITALRGLDVVVLATSLDEAITELNRLMASPDEAQALAERGYAFMKSANGAVDLAMRIDAMTRGE